MYFTTFLKLIWILITCCFEGVQQFLTCKAAIDCCYFDFTTMNVMYFSVCCTVGEGSDYPASNRWFSLFYKNTESIGDQSLDCFLFFFSNLQINKLIEYYQQLAHREKQERDRKKLARRRQCMPLAFSVLCSLWVQFSLFKNVTIPSSLTFLNAKQLLSHCNVTECTGPVWNGSDMNFRF